MMEQINFTDVLLAIVGFLIVYTLNSIKGEIREVKVTMQSLSAELTKIDKRVVAIETAQRLGVCNNGNFNS